jgi:predicted Zn-dependent protease
MIVGGQAAAAQNQLNFSRDMEREADRVGFGVMTQAGYAPQGFVTMFEKLQQSSRFNDGGGFAYLRSHPLTTERIADMQSRVPQAQQGALRAVTPLDHALVAARARALANSGVDALRAWAKEAEPAHFDGLSPAAQAGTLYGACFAGLKLRDFSQTQKLLAQLLERTRASAPAQRLSRLLAAEIAVAQADWPTAAKHLQGLESSGRTALFLSAHIDSRTGKAVNAAQNLQTWLADHPRDAQAWQLLAQANIALGRVVAAVRDEAEVNVAQLDYGSAVTRFRAAQELARKAGPDADPIEAAVVQTRARQVELLFREQALER